MMTLLSIWRGPIRLQTMAAIAAHVAERSGLEVEDLKGPRKFPQIAHARQEAFALCMGTGRFSSTQVGRFFGGRGNGTVLHGTKAHNRRASA